MTSPRELTPKRAADIAAYALIKVACKEAELILEVLDGLAFERDRNSCDACAGTGTPTSGPGCMCGGSGKMSDAAHYLRERYAAEKVRADGLETRLTDMEEQVALAEIDRKSAKIAYDQLQSALDERDAARTELETAKVVVTNGAMVKCVACGSDAFNVCTHLLGDMVTAPAERDTARVENERLRNALRDADTWLTGMQSLTLDSRIEHAVDFIRAARVVPSTVHGEVQTRHGLGLSHSEITQACRNIGFDLTCGACAGVFYTGSGLGEHTCKTVSYPWTGTLNDKTRWTAVYESGVTEGRRLGGEEVLVLLRSGPPSSWCMYNIREGLADDIVAELAHSRPLPADPRFSDRPCFTPRQLEAAKAEAIAEHVAMHDAFCAEMDRQHSDCETKREKAEAERDDLQTRLTKTVGILDARHTGAGALAANDATRKAALEFIAAEKARR